LIRASGSFSITALFSNTGACSFQPIPQVNCQKGMIVMMIIGRCNDTVLVFSLNESYFLDSCRQVTSSHYFPDIVHFIGANCNYVSKDRGITWNRQQLSKTFYYYVYHPTNKAWVLAFNQVIIRYSSLLISLLAK
jgi:hypothetical protein